QRDGEYVVASGEYRRRDPDRRLLECLGRHLRILTLLWLHDGYAVRALLRGPARGVRPHPLRHPGHAGRRAIWHGARSGQQGDVRDCLHADGGPIQAGRSSAVSERAADDALGQTQSAAVHVPARGARAALLQEQPRRLTLHALVLRPAAALPRRPAWSQHIGRLAVDAVGRVDAETILA